MTQLYLLPIVISGFVIAGAARYPARPVTPELLAPFVQLDTLAHLGLYSCLGASAALCLSRSCKFTPVKLLALTGFICLLFGIADEAHQTLVPGRNGEFRDLLADLCGGITGGTIYILATSKRSVFQGFRHRGQSANCMRSSGRAMATALGALTVIMIGANIFTVTPLASGLACNTRDVVSHVLSMSISGSHKTASRPTLHGGEMTSRELSETTPPPVVSVDTLNPKYGREAVTLATREVARELAVQIMDELRQEMQAQLK